MIQGYRLASKGFPPKAQGHVSQGCIGYFAAAVGYGSAATFSALWVDVRFFPNGDRIASSPAAGLTPSAR
jgi:hypothetical protein